VSAGSAAAPSAVAPGCAPASGAAISFARTNLPKGDSRALFSVWADQPDDWLQIDERKFDLRRGHNDLSFALPAAAPRHWQVSASPGSRIALIGVVPRTDDIPSPPPEPFEATEAAAAEAPEHHL
jgi:hypothetical protein